MSEMEVGRFLTSGDLASGAGLWARRRIARSILLLNAGFDPLSKLCQSVDVIIFLWPASVNFVPKVPALVFEESGYHEKIAIGLRENGARRLGLCAFAFWSAHVFIVPACLSRQMTSASTPHP